MGKAVIRKGSAETQDCVSCQDMEADDDRSLEEMGFVPNAVSDSSGSQEPSTCVTRKCKSRGLQV